MQTILMSPSKQTRPSTDPVPVRFSEDQLAMIHKVADDLGMSRADVIRLAVSAGLKIMIRLGPGGLTDLIAAQAGK